MKRFYKGIAKKTLLTIYIVLSSMINFAVTYHVSNAGNDTNNGLSKASPWQTLTKVNSATLVAGDSILFRRGDIFTGTIVPQKSGTTSSNIVYGAYGTGNKPIFSGFETITGWKDIGNGIYSASTTAAASCSIVTVNGVNTPMGRYPKTGWLTFESFSGTTSITDNQLTGTPSWTGAEVVIKKHNWIIDRSLITNHSGSTITYTSGSVWAPEIDGGYGYFIQKSINCLTTIGDWYCNGTTFYMYFGTENPNNYIVNASILDILINISTKDYLVFENLKLKGANTKAYYEYACTKNTLKNCDFELCGDNAINLNYSVGTLMDGINVSNSNGTGLNIISKGYILKNSSVSNCGVFAGMGNTGGSTFQGIYVKGDNGVCEYNTVTNVGYIGIQFYGNNSKIRYNKVDNCCSLLTDGGGIYTFYGTVGTPQSGIQVYNNVVLNSGGNGLYSDGISNNIEFFNNTVFNIGKWGIHMNEPVSNKVHDNTFLNCGLSGINITNLYYQEVSASGNIISSNIVVQGLNTQYLMDLIDARTYTVGNFGTSDNNKFIAESNSINLYKTQVSQPSFLINKYSFANWKTFSGQEANSTLTAINLSDVQFEYNSSQISRTISLTAPMIDATGKKYSNSITLQPYTSVVLMKDLSIVPMYYSEYKSICDGGSYNGWTTSGVYERKLVAVSGGDSIVTTNLSVNPKFNIIEDISITEGSNYQGWTNAGTYVRKLSSRYGCDSIVTTNLTVIPLIIKQGEVVPSHYTTVWQGENGQNHMNFVVVSAILEDLPLSIDDEIALFSGSACVGTKKLTQSINPTDNSTFLTIPASQNDGSNNGFIDNDTIIFKIWDNKNQKEMLAKAVAYRNDIPTWLTSGKYSPGSTAVVDIVSYAEYTQTIDLKKGYNMISTYVTAQNSNASSVTKPLIDQGYLIKMQDEAGNSFENWGSFGGWINKLGSIEKTEGYKIKVANNCTLQVTGRPIALPLDISLKAGWNIISFPRTDMVDGKTVIQSLIDQNKLVKVQDEVGNSIENWGIFGGWKNGIGNFVPGKAYKVKLNSDGILTLQQSYPKSAVIFTKSEMPVHFSTEVEGNGSDHMNINIVGLRESGISIGDELAAFDGDICVGALKLTDYNLNSGSASLAASLSDNDDQGGFKEGHSIQILIWNAQSGEESKAQTEIMSGKMIFEKQSSVFVKLNSLTTGIQDMQDLVKIDVFPNPCRDNVSVRFSEMPGSEGRIEIMDISGRKVESREITSTNERFYLGQQPAGLYMVKTIIGSKKVVNKLIINK